MLDKGSEGADFFQNSPKGSRARENSSACPQRGLRERRGPPVRQASPPTHGAPPFSGNTPADSEVLAADRSFLAMLRPLLQDLNFPSRTPDVDATSVCTVADLWGIWLKRWQAGLWKENWALCASHWHSALLTSQVRAPCPRKRFTLQLGLSSPCR